MNGLLEAGSLLGEDEIPIDYWWIPHREREQRGIRRVELMKKTRRIVLLSDGACHDSDDPVFVALVRHASIMTRASLWSTPAGIRMEEVRVR